MTDRIRSLKEKMLSEPRFASIEQALIITNTYKKNEGKPRIIQRALALKASFGTDADQSGKRRADRGKPDGGGPLWSGVSGVRKHLGR